MGAPCLSNSLTLLALKPYVASKDVPWRWVFVVAMGVLYKGILQPFPNYPSGSEDWTAAAQNSARGWRMPSTSLHSTEPSTSPPPSGSTRSSSPPAHI